MKRGISGNFSREKFPDKQGIIRENLFYEFAIRIPLINREITAEYQRNL
jgi:hypothetical protein